MTGSRALYVGAPTTLGTHYVVPDNLSTHATPRCLARLERSPPADRRDRVQQGRQAGDLVPVPRTM
jgi:hypothetical protein